MGVAAGMGIRKEAKQDISSTAQDIDSLIGEGVEFGVGGYLNELRDVRNSAIRRKNAADRQQ